jgi:hypothetical protein
LSIGSFLKRVTTVPKHGLLSPLRAIVGKSGSFADELGGLAGFALGGPAGAALGSGAGSLVHGSSIGSALGNAAKGYLGGVGANAALAGFGGGGLAGAAGEINNGLVKPVFGVGKSLMGKGGVPGAPGVPGSGTDAVGATGGHSGGIGDFLSGAANWLTDPTRGENRLRLLSTGLGAGGAYLTGQAEQGQANATNALAQGGLDLNRQSQNFNEEQIRLERERRAQLDPVRMRLLESLTERLAAPRRA